MKTMRHKISITAYALAAIISFAPAAAFAAPAFDVEFERTPLFQSRNLAPGDSVTGWVKVTNGTGSDLTAGTDAQNATGANELGAGMRLTVLDGETKVLDMGLADFLEGGEFPLSTVSANSTKTYDFVVTFESSSGDSYQGKSTGFDLCVGFMSESGGTCDRPGGGSGGEGTGGGGGGGGTQTLTVFNERATPLDEQSGDVLISWETSRPADGRVVFGPASGAYALDLGSAPFFGYPSGSEADANELLRHTVVLRNVAPGAYKYRIVAWNGSKTSTGFERTFAIPEPASRRTDSVAGGAGLAGPTTGRSTLSRGSAAAAASGSSTGTPAIALAESGQDESLRPAPNGNLAAAFFGIPDWLALPLTYASIFLFLILILFVLWKSRRKKRDPQA